MSARKIFEAHLYTCGLQNNIFINQFKNEVLPLYEELNSEMLSWDQISAIFKLAEKISSPNTSPSDKLITIKDKIKDKMKSILSKALQSSVTHTDIRKFAQKVNGKFAENGYSKEYQDKINKLAKYATNNPNHSSAVIAIFGTILSTINPNTPESTIESILDVGIQSLRSNRRVDPTININDMR